MLELSVGFRGLFVDAGAPPAMENMRKPSALESTGKNIYLSQVPAHSQTLIKRTVTTKFPTRICS